MREQQRERRRRQRQEKLTTIVVPLAIDEQHEADDRERRQRCPQEQAAMIGESILNGVIGSKPLKGFRVLASTGWAQARTRPTADRSGK